MQQRGRNHNRLQIAVSACLLGESVRYDGGHKRHPFVADVLAGQCELIAICPEVAIGLGAPRPPIRLLRTGNLIQARGVTNIEQDFTAALHAYAQQQVRRWADIDGYIFKSRSPSCGLNDVPVTPEGVGAGVYAAEWLRCVPELPMVDDLALKDTRGQQLFLERVRAYHDQKQKR